MFAPITKKCSNPECNYPLSALVEHHYSINFQGKVCELCHTMEDAANQQPGLRAAQETWKQEKRRKDKLAQNE